MGKPSVGGRRPSGPELEELFAKLLPELIRQCHTNAATIGAVKSVLGGGRDPNMSSERPFAREDVKDILDHLCEVNIRLGIHKELGQAAQEYRRNVMGTILSTYLYLPDPLPERFGGYFEYAVLVDPRVSVGRQMFLAGFDEEVTLSHEFPYAEIPSRYWEILIQEPFRRGREHPYLLWATDGRHLRRKVEQGKLTVSLRGDETPLTFGECVALATQYPKLFSAERGYEIAPLEGVFAYEWREYGNYNEMRTEQRQAFPIIFSTIRHGAPRYRAIDIDRCNSERLGFPTCLTMNARGVVGEEM